MRRLLAVLTALTLAGAACGDDGGTRAAEHNDADLVFAQKMVPHHEQAVSMSDMALQKAESPKVKELAERIKSARGPR
jgi:uncharacterized protein (DUF305 family)